MLLKQLGKYTTTLTTLLQRSIYKNSNVIYLDYQATTPIDYRVQDAMTPYMLQYFGNPHSKTHQFGWDSNKGVEVAR
jgi:cysteine desulfurase